MIEQRDQVALANGEQDDSDGVYVAQLRWGRLASLHIYTDNEVVAAAVRRMTAQGINEADAPEIEH